MSIQLRLLFLMSIAQCLLGFNNIEELQLYEKSLPEILYHDTQEQGFKKLHTVAPGWWENLLIRIGLKKGPVWSPLNAYSIITGMYDLFTEKTYEKQEALTVPEGTEFIVFGGIRGEFHSLTRSIGDLHCHGYMTHDFKLKPHTYLVFLGDTLDLSTSGLETLSLILTLLQANTNNVIFLAGQLESKQAWRNSLLPKELELRIPTYAADLTKKIDLIFSKLPSELLITLKETQETLSFSAFAHPHEGTSVFITSDHDAPAYQEGQGLYKKLSAKEPIAWQVVSTPTRRYRMEHKFFYTAYACIGLSTSLNMSTISLYTSIGIHPFIPYATYNLLTGTLLTRGQPLPPIADDTTKLSPEELTLHISTIGELTSWLTQEISTIAAQLPKTTFIPPTFDVPPLIEKLRKGTLLTQEERQQAIHHLELTYNTLSAEVSKLQSLAQEKGLKVEYSTSHDTKDRFTLGSSLDLTKSAKGIGIPFKTGMSLKVHEQNRSGGIHGKRAHIIFLDDANRPALSEKNIETLYEVDHTPYILAPVGSATLAASLDLIEEKKILVLFPQSGSLLFRKPELTQVINFRASFHDEGRLLTEFVLEHYRSKNFVFFTQDDEFGSSTLEGAKQALEKAKNTHSTDVTYQVNTSNFESAATKIKEANPDAIGFFALGPAVLELIRDLGVEFLANKILFAVSSVGDTATKKVLQQWGISPIRSQVVPEPATSTLPIANEYRTELKSQGLKEDLFSFEAYINTSLTFHAMNAITEPITMQKLITYFEKMKNQDFKGLTLTFNPTTRSLSQNVWIIDKEGTSHQMNTGGAHESSS